MRITLSETEVNSMVSDWVEKHMSGWTYQDSAIDDGSIEVAVEATVEPATLSVHKPSIDVGSSGEAA